MIFGPILISFPVLIALTASIITFLLPARRLTARLFLCLHLASCIILTSNTIHKGPQAITAGNWLAPYGIILIVDVFAAILLSFASFIFICCLIEEKNDTSPFYWPLIFLLQAGVSLSFITGDLFNLFVAFELMLMASYAILTTQGKQGRNNAYSYLAMNISASCIFLISIAEFYSYTGELSFATLSQHLASSESHLKWIPMLTLILVMAVKGGLFPLYFWLPDSYPVLPSRLAALFSGILSKVGLYVLFRLLLTIFPNNPVLNNVLMILASFTMFFGVMGAVSRNSIPGILSYHVLSQIGYIVLALSLSSPLAITAGIFFILHNMVVKSSLFLIGGITKSYCGSTQLSLVGGLWKKTPFLGILFLLQALSLSGLPPFSGFWCKYLLFFEGISLGAYTAVSVATITAFFTLYSMLKIWNAAFIGQQQVFDDSEPKKRYLGAILLTLLALGMGLLPQSSYLLSSLAAEQVLNRDLYISVSLEAGHKG